MDGDRMKVSDAVAKYLAHEGVRVIFGYQGGAITHLIDSFDRAGIAYIQNYNEQGSGLAADAYARIEKDGLGVAIATNGPGATNLVTAIANAYCDSVPVLFLTGQVHTFAMKKSPLIRQESFQEIDILSITGSITKYAVTVMEKERVLPELSKAIAIAKDGRKGPVQVDIPVDVQGMQIAEELLTDCIEHPYRVQHEPEETENGATGKITENVQKANELLLHAKRPLIIAGGGIRLDGAAEAFRKMVHRQGIPVAASMMGLDAMDHGDPYFAGFLGSYGNRYVNIAVQKADVILVLGSRLDMRQTGKRKDLFAVDAKLIHVDVDEYELGHFVKEDVNIACTVSEFLHAWDRILADNDHAESGNCADNADRVAWMDTINNWKQKYPDDEELAIRPECRKNNPNVILKHLGALLPEHTIVCSDVGQNQLWVAQSVRVKGADVRILNSGGLGTMGYALPAAIGAYYADPKATVVACMGDGGFQMNIQELQLIGNRQLPITILIMNNHALGLIRDTHEKYYDKRYVGSVWGFSLPDLEYLCKAYRLKYIKPGNLEELTDAVRNVTGPKLIEIEFTENTYVYPELGGNDALDHQMPYRD